MPRKSPQNRAAIPLWLRDIATLVDGLASLGFHIAQDVRRARHCPPNPAPPGVKNQPGPAGREKPTRPRRA